MRASHNATKDIDERANARMNIRTKPCVKKAIQQAAALSGVSATAFTVNSAYRSALEVIAEYEHTTLHQADHATFFSSLDHPEGPTEDLQGAFVRYRATVAPK
ncbi:DUF1778 domain-containing protein [Pelagibacterium halotolerans]|uniref:type II toxin-antitoxin system TacA family antitoxin n=1 Tax=Pelagibacterium halotolerans TaxID=531813 RepID=UPI00384AFA56